MAKPREPKAPKPPKPWERDAPGRYRSADGRFVIEQGGGRWFVIDQEQVDDLGLARTVGPFGTLDDAKAKADELRAAPPEESPLDAKGGGDAAGRRSKLRVVRDDEAGAESKTKPRAAPPKPKPTWIDQLSDREARRVRTRIAGLASLGASSPEGLVKKDRDGDVPAAATFVLGRAIRRAALDPWSRDDAFAGVDRAMARVLARLHKAGASDDDLRDLADEVARLTIDRALEVVSTRERDADAPSAVPGWQLVENDTEREGEPRRIFLSVDDLPAAEE